MSEFGHYFKDVSGLQKIDVYRVVELFEVPAGALDHAAKKILCAGFRGVKDQLKDVREAHKSLGRWLEMRAEDDRAAAIRKAVESGDIVLEFDGVIADLKPALWGAPAEPAAAIDDESPRAQALGQNGNTGEHYRCHECLAEHCACLAQ